MDGMLVVVPCGAAKVWKKDHLRGPTPAKDAYVGAPFKVNREYAEFFGKRWVILSAKYGVITPETPINDYNVTFKRPSSETVSVASLRQQVQELGLRDFTTIVVLGGEDYRMNAQAAFSPRQVTSPFAGLPIGIAMGAIKRSISMKRPFP